MDSAPIDYAPAPREPGYDPMGFGDENQQRADREARAAGVQTVTRVRTNYWGSDLKYKFYLDDESVPEDERQFIEYKKLNEGERSKYQKQISDPVLVHRGSGDARMKVDPARDRDALLRVAVCGWLLWKGDRPANFNETQFNLWKNAADPELIDKLEKAIRKANPWLKSDMKLEDAREERDRLIQLVEDLEAEEEEKKRISRAD